MGIVMSKQSAANAAEYQQGPNMGRWNAAVIRIISVLMLLVAMPAISQAQQGASQAIDFQECFNECNTSKPTGYPCWSWCGWKACEKANVMTSEFIIGGQARPSRDEKATGTDSFEAPAARTPPDYSVLPRNNPCASTHFACTPHCDVYVRDMKRYSQQVSTSSEKIQQCDFPAIKRRYDLLISAAPHSPQGNPELKNFYETYYKDVVPLESEFNNAVADLPGKLTLAAGALKQCRPYSIVLSDPETRVLKRCAPGLYHQVEMMNRSVREQAEAWQTTEGIAQERTNAALKSLDLCLATPILTTDIMHVVMRCDPPLGQSIQDTNRRIDALGKALNAANKDLLQAQEELAACRNLPTKRDALRRLIATPILAQHHCPELTAAQQLERRISDVINGFENDRRAVQNLLKSASSNYRYCEWDEYDQKIGQARTRHLGDPACWHSAPEYVELTKLVNDQERLGRERADLAHMHTHNLDVRMQSLRPHLEGRSGANSCAQGIQANLAQNIPKLAAALDAAIRDDVGDCMLELIQQGRATLSAAQELLARCQSQPQLGRFDILGTEWAIHEGAGYRYPATLTRMGSSNVFAATFDGHSHPSNKVTITINEGNVTMERDQYPMPGEVNRRTCTYTGRLYKGDGSTDLNMAEGTFNCNFFSQHNIPKNIPWRAKIIGQRRQ